MPSVSSARTTIVVNFYNLTCPIFISTFGIRIAIRWTICHYHLVSHQGRVYSIRSLVKSTHFDHSRYHLAEWLRRPCPHRVIISSVFRYKIACCSWPATNLDETIFVHTSSTHVNYEHNRTTASKPRANISVLVCEALQWWCLVHLHRWWNAWREVATGGFNPWYLAGSLVVKRAGRDCHHGLHYSWNCQKNTGTWRLSKPCFSGIFIWHTALIALILHHNTRYAAKMVPNKWLYFGSGICCW